MATTRQPYSYVSDNPLNGSDPSGLFGCPSWMPGWACGLSNAIASAPAAVAKSGELNGLSAASWAPCITYKEAYDFNLNVTPHLPTQFSIRATCSSGMSSLQHFALSVDEWIDVIQAREGYPGTAEPDPRNDERMRVNYLPSIIYPEWNGSAWTQQKFTYGPTTSGPGRGPNGREDYS